MVYIDAHTHFGGKMPQGIPPERVDECITMMDQIGMDAIVTSPPRAAASADRTFGNANVQLLEAMKSHPKRIYGLARINPHYRQKAVEEAEKALTDGFFGIKFHPRNEGYAIDNRELVFPIMEKVRKLGGLALFHTGCPVYSHPTLVGYVAEYFPEVPIILGHMGAEYPDDAILVARWFDNVVVDSSFCAGVNAIEKAVEIAGAEKIVYASDYPQGSMEIDTLKVNLADISDHDKELILGRNIRRILDSVAKDR